jgi:hypothetical protein
VISNISGDYINRVLFDVAVNIRWMALLAGLPTDIRAAPTVGVRKQVTWSKGPPNGLVVAHDVEYLGVPDGTLVEGVVFYQSQTAPYPLFYGLVVEPALVSEKQLGATVLRTVTIPKNSVVFRVE